MVTQAGRVTRSMLHWKQEEQEGGDTGNKRNRKESTWKARETIGTRHKKQEEPKEIRNLD